MLDIDLPFARDARPTLSDTDDRGATFKVTSADNITACDDGTITSIRYDRQTQTMAVTIQHAWGQSFYHGGERLSLPIELQPGQLINKGDRIMRGDPTEIFGLDLTDEDGKTIEVWPLIEAQYERLIAPTRIPVHEEHITTEPTELSGPLPPADPAQPPATSRKKATAETQTS